MSRHQAACVPAPLSLTQMTIEELEVFFETHTDALSRTHLLEEIERRRSENLKDLRARVLHALGDFPEDEEGATGDVYPPFRQGMGSDDSGSDSSKIEMNVITNIHVHTIHLSQTQINQAEVPSYADAPHERDKSFVAQESSASFHAERASSHSTDAQDAPCDETMENPLYGPQMQDEDEASCIAQMSMAERVLCTWSALDILTPQPFEKPRGSRTNDSQRVLHVASTLMPWNNAHPIQEKSIFYQVVLGVIDLPKAYKALFEIYADEDMERPKVKGQTLLATCTLDDKGMLLESSFSSFAWGLPIALKGQLLGLAVWEKESARLQEELEMKLGHGTPLTRQRLEEAHAWLVETLHLPQEMVSGPLWDVIKITKKHPSPPESLLLPPFYLPDLQRARSLLCAQQLPKSLAHYLGEISPAVRHDILQEEDVLQDALDPSKMPLGGWPTPGGHGLVTLQQACVNLAKETLRDGALLSVNGPPGTGKTTLLRDVVANAVIERAVAMAKFDTPDRAFIKTSHKVPFENGAFYIHTLDETLRGHEVLLASSNNKAVENVSKELPDLRAVDACLSQQGYFRHISDALAQGKQTWGLIAATLGNAKNKRHFAETFWWENDTALRGYLKCAYGGGRQEITKDGVTRLAKIITQESPPQNAAQALEEWQRARTCFVEVQSKAQTLLDQAKEAKEQIDELARLQGALMTLEAEYLCVTREKLTATQKACESYQGYMDALKLVDESASALLIVKNKRPGFWKRYFMWWQHKAWWQSYDMKRGSLKKAELNAQLCEHLNTQWEEALSTLERRLDALERVCAQERAAVERQRGILEPFREILGGTFVDEDFMALSHGLRHKASLWFDQKNLGIRGELFASAMHLHRAFIGAAARPLSQNLALMMGVLASGKMRDPLHDIYLPHLWSSLFLVVPLLATTFASVARMLGELTPNSIGWLLIDEAGQALPQAALGAIMRAQRTLAVGDPLQIEPVVTLPESLATSICRKFLVDEKVYNAPTASVQTLCDAASPYGAYFGPQGEGRRVGLPLLVHRRCEDPMFRLSNAIAYANLMVHAKTGAPSPIRDVLGISNWFHVDGSDTKGKWNPREGDVVLSLLNRLHDAGVGPHFYIITPFLEVKDALYHLVKSQTHLHEWLIASVASSPMGDGDETSAYHSKIAAWCHGHIGTVHTFQGREAEAVIFVLGAGDPSQTRARQWAGKSVNLLNVAATRAKEVLYVVGDKQKWHAAGVFRELASHL